MPWIQLWPQQNFNKYCQKAYKVIFLICQYYENISETRRNYTTYTIYVEMYPNTSDFHL
jgi:hypothetical protein